MTDNHTTLLNDEPQTWDHVLGDGTPVKDILDHNRELAAEVTDLKRRLREIIHLCNAAITPAAKRIAILEVTRRK